MYANFLFHIFSEIHSGEWNAEKILPDFSFSRRIARSVTAALYLQCFESTPTHKLEHSVNYL